MTALRPTENARVVGVKDGQMKLLRKLVLNKVCGHPECDSPTDDAHHCFARSLITNDSWWVEIDDDEGKKVIPHVIGLCRAHHNQVEIHEAWIKLEDGVFNWHYRVDINGIEHVSGEHIQGTEWIPSGPLTPQPGEVGAVKKKITGKKRGEVRPYRAQWNVGVPKDERENGADVLDELELAVRSELKAKGVEHVSEDAPRYHIVLAALVRFLQ